LDGRTDNSSGNNRIACDEAKRSCAIERHRVT
jgi:hypothetical protein